jgi:hypothetical protein
MADLKGKKRVINDAPVKGVDESGNAVDIGVTGVEKNSLKVEDENSNLLKEILIEQKITNQYLLLIVGFDSEVTEDEIKD